MVSRGILRLAVDEADVSQPQGQPEPAALLPPGGSQSFRVALGVGCGQGRSSRVAGLTGVRDAPSIAGRGPWTASSAAV